MALIYTYTGDETLGVNAGNAIHGSLYNANGHRLEATDRMSYDACAFVGAPTGATGTIVTNYGIILFVNMSAARRVRLRQMQTFANNVSGATAATISIQISRAKFPQGYFYNNVGAGLVVASLRQINRKTTSAPPSGVLLATSPNAASITGPGMYDAAPMGTFAIPQRANAMAQLNFDFFDDSLDAALIFDAWEGMVFNVSGTGITNVFMAHFDWDEEQV